MSFTAQGDVTACSCKPWAGEPSPAKAQEGWKTLDPMVPSWWVLAYFMSLPLHLFVQSNLSGSSLSLGHPMDVGEVGYPCSREGGVSYASRV